MSPKKHKKKKAAASGSAPKSSVEAFREVADRLASDTPAFEAVFAEPWPDWMVKMAIQFSRISAPEVMKAAKTGDDEKMFGHIAAAESQMVDLLKELKVIEQLKAENDPRWKFMEEQLEIVAGPEAARINETLKAAADLPLQHGGSFFKAYGDGLANGAFEQTLDRVNSSTTAQICMFTMMQRLAIEKKVFKNVTQLAEVFLKLKELTGEIAAEKLAVRASITAQFRKICSEAGLKLSSRGRPSNK
ncbi:MAG: hypothetical protein P4L99_29320 [Chthoniobacter sp.]|nr:hypothetical protein [Chthoniobacter sp.]